MSLETREATNRFWSICTFTARLSSAFKHVFMPSDLLTSKSAIRALWPHLLGLYSDSVSVCAFVFVFCSLAKPEHVEKLFNYVTKEPSSEASENVKFRCVTWQVCGGGRNAHSVGRSRCDRAVLWSVLLFWRAFRRCTCGFCRYIRIRRGENRI